MANETTSTAEGSSLSQFFTTLISAGVIAGVQILLFLCLRTLFKRIYAPKTYLVDEERRVKPLPKGVLGWLPALLRLPPEDLIRTSGLDAYFFARYLSVHAVFFLVSFVLLAAILFPIYAVRGKGEPFGKSGLDLLTFGNICPSHSSRYAAPLVLAYAFVGAFLFVLHGEMRAFVATRQAFLRSPAYRSQVSASTVLVTSIPPSYMSADVLHRIFDHFPGGVRSIWLNRQLKDLPSKAEERTKLVNKLETTLCQLMRSALKTTHVDGRGENVNAFDRWIPERRRPTMRVGGVSLLSSLCRPGGRKVDTLSYCKERIAALNTDLERARHALHAYPPLNSAFVQFNQQIAAHMAAQSVSGSVPLTLTPRYIDVNPSTVLWANLDLTFYQRKVRQWLSLALTTALIVFWAIPVAFVGVLSNLPYLTGKAPFLRFIYQLPPSLLGLLTGLLPTVLLAVLMALLPIVLRLLAKLSGLPTVDAVDRHVQGSYFVFQVVHVFLVVTISSSVSSVVVSIIQSPASAATILAANIPTASNFFLSFLALQGLSVASGVLLQLVALLLFYALRKLFDNTPRKLARRHFALSTLSWGTVFPIFTNFVVIAVVYSVIAPLILLVAGLAFVFFYVAYLYTMFFVSDFPNESGGLAFPRAVHQSFTGVYLMELLLAGLFFLAQDERGRQAAVPQGILMCLLIAITGVVQWTIFVSFHPLTTFLPVDADEHARLQKPTEEEKEKKKKRSVPASWLKTPSDQRDEASARQWAYSHPAIRARQPVVWLPEDRLGIAADQVRRLAISGLNLAASTARARFNAKNKIEVDGPPPDDGDDDEQLATDQDVQTRF